jgi:prepilin-type N-terminal cleavage/methylation domain-containing protein
MNTKTPTHRSGFTLIEMLVVIAIIAILAGLLFPAINRALETAKRNQAAADVRAIAAAINMFYNDYGYLPIPLSDQGTVADRDDANDGATLTPAESRRIIQVLTAVPQGHNAGHELNPRRKVYLSGPNFNEDGEFLDPWGRQYIIKLDTNFDGVVEFNGVNHRTRVIVASGGRDNQMFGPGNTVITNVQ